jgi:hypothetical protein
VPVPNPVRVDDPDGDVVRRPGVDLHEGLHARRY